MLQELFILLMNVEAPARKGCVGWARLNISSILYESDPAEMTFGYGHCQGCQGERRATDDLGELCDFPHATHPSLRNVALAHPDGHGHPTQQDSKGANHQTPLYKSFWYWMIWYIIHRHSIHAWKGVCGIRHWWFYWTILECWMGTLKAGHPKADANSAEVKAPEEPKPGQGCSNP